MGRDAIGISHSAPGRANRETVGKSRSLPDVEDAAAGAGLNWSSERRHVRSSLGIDLGAREGGGIEAGFRITREW